MNETASFGYWVRRQRKALDLTQSMLAEQVGCALVTVKKIERDERRPSIEMAELLADHLAIVDTDRDKFIKMARGQWTDIAMAPTAPIEASTTRLSIPHNLPQQPTSFVGRKTELAELESLLADPDKRLVTILGPGGMGKTRLSLAAADTQRLSDRFKDGIYFVPLASVHDRTLLVTTIADAIGSSIALSPQPEETLLSQLSERQMLIVLDNFEQLNTEADLVEDILVAAPGIKLMVSSRERLNVGHEWVVDLQGLPIPTELATADGAAAELFVQRAQQVRSAFELAGNESAVTRICQLVDGMPLGIELAANWIRVMQATEIVIEIERSIDFLMTKQRDIPARHRSIRAVFQSTWAQLPPQEQQIFNQLSIFRNGFTYDAATKVTGATPAILLSLIDSSLLTRDNSGRYEIHELLRQFGQFELAVVPEEENKARAAHAAYFAALMERLNPDLYSDAQMRAGILIEDDLENILLAWRWFVDNSAGDGLHQMMDSLHEFCDRSGHCLSGSTAFHQANQALRSMSESNRIRPGLRGALSIYDGLFSQRLGSTDWPAMGDAQMLLDDPFLKPAHLAKIYSEIALTQYFLGQLETTEYLLDAAMRVATTAEDDWSIGIVFCVRAHIDEYQGDFRLAVANFEASIEALTNVGDQVRLAYSLNNLGRAAYAMGNYTRAEEVIQAALEIRRRFQDVVGIAYSLLDMAKLYRMLGKYDEAEIYLIEGDALCRQSGLEDTLARYHNGWGMLERVRGRPELAIDLHRSAQRIYQTETIHAHLPQTLNSLAAANMAVGAHDHAEELLVDSLALARSLGNIFDQAMALALLGETNLAQAQPDAAGELLDQALGLADQRGAAPLALQIVYIVAQDLVRRQADQPQKAIALLRYVAYHPATEADIRSRAEECLLEFDTLDDIEDLSDHDIWRVVADLRSGPRQQVTATP